MCVGRSSFGSSTLLLLLDLMSVICNGNVTDAEVPSQLNDLPPEFNPVPVDQPAHLAEGPVCMQRQLSARDALTQSVASSIKRFWLTLPLSFIVVISFLTTECNNESIECNDKSIECNTLILVFYSSQRQVAADNWCFESRSFWLVGPRWVLTFERGAGAATDGWRVLVTLIGGENKS